MLGDRLRQIINTLGIKSGEFAEKINFSQAYISMLLNGSKQNPSERFFEAIKREFNIDPEWVRNGTGEMFISGDVKFTPLEKELLKKYNSLPLAERSIIDKIVDALLLQHVSDVGKSADHGTEN